MGIISFIAMIVCLATIVLGIIITGGELGNFLSASSVLLTIVPTIGALFVAFPISLLAKVPAHMKVIIGKGYQLEDYINGIVGIARKARTEGLLSLENEKVDGPFMEYALRLLVDGMDEESIKRSLEGSLEATTNRHNEAVSIYERAAAFAPAFGMCATVIALINMLMGLDFSNPDAINDIGANMSMALITTFYGSVLANVIFLPLAARLKTLHKREVFCKTVIGDSFLAIQRGENPSLIQDALLQQLSLKSQKRFSGGGGAVK